MSSTQHAKFQALIQDVSQDQRAFIVVRTAYDPDPDPATDASKWASAFDALRAHQGSNSDVELLVMEDRSSLDGVDADAVRLAFNAWVAEYCQRSHNDEDGEEPTWNLDVRRDCCLVVDDLALESLLAAPSKPAPLTTQGYPGPKTAGLNPWVVVVDSRSPEEVGYHGGSPYLGWFRAEARFLGELMSNVERRDVYKLCPSREYDGQIPVYVDGCGKGLVDPSGGVEGRYKFPMGTPRGREGAMAMLEDIRAALGDEAVARVSVAFEASSGSGSRHANRGR